MRAPLLEMGTSNNVGFEKVKAAEIGVGLDVALTLMERRAAKEGWHLTCIVLGKVVDTEAILIAEIHKGMSSQSN